MLSTNEIIQICLPAIYPDNNEPVCGICGESMRRRTDLDLPNQKAYVCLSYHVSYGGVYANTCFVGGRSQRFEGEFINTLF